MGCPSYEPEGGHRKHHPRRRIALAVSRHYPDLFCDRFLPVICRRVLIVAAAKESLFLAKDSVEGAAAAKKEKLRGEIQENIESKQQ